MSDAITTQGVLFQRGNGATPEVFTTIGEVVSFNGPDGSASEIDVTSLTSSAKEFRLGLYDEGQISFECNLLPVDTAQIGLRADRAAGTQRNFQIVLTDTGTTTLSFAAFVKQFAISGGVDAVMKASVTLRVTGTVTWA
jgi:hypothetical protein